MVNPGEFEHLRKLARTLTADEGDDLVQEAYLARLEGRGASRQTPSYLGQSLRYRWLMRLRADGRRRRRESAFASMQVGGSGDPELAAISLALRQALGRLSEDQRSLLEARFVEGREPREIAEALGLDPGVVRQRIHRALGELRAEFDDETQRRHGLFALVFGGPRRLVGLGLGLAGLAALVLSGSTLCSGEEVRAPEAKAERAEGSAASVASLDPEPGAAPEHSEVEEAKAKAPPPDDQVPDLLAGAYLLREYRDAYKAISSEVQRSFIGCLREHNESPPDPPVELNGRSVFRVHLRRDPETGTTVEKVETLEDEASARELATCVRESLPTIHVEDPSLETPARFRVVLDLDRRMALAKGELDLGGLPEDLRSDAALLTRLGGYLSKGEPPDFALDAVADFALALADGTISADELDDGTLASLRELAASETPSE